MNKEEFRKYLYAEPHEWKKLTPEEAFNEGVRAAKGIRPDMTGYDIAGRSLARAILEWVKKSPANKEEFDRRCKTPKYLSLGMAGVGLDDIPEIKAAKDKVDPTGFMYGWAVSSVRWLVDEREVLESE